MKKQVPCVMFLLAALLTAGCSAAHKNYTDAGKLVEQGQLEEAMFRYAEASRLEPESPQYRVRFLQTRQAAAMARARKGDLFMEQKRYADAINEYQTAAGLDPSQSRHAQRAKEATSCLQAEIAYEEGSTFEKSNKLREAMASYAKAYELMPDQDRYQQALKRTSELNRTKPEGVELQLKSRQPITLSFRDARLKDAFGAVSQLSGINFIFDDAVKDQNVTITLEKATFQQALELLTGMYKLGRKILNETTVLVYPLTPDKLKQYEELVMRTYHLNHLDAKKAVNMVRAVMQIKKIYVNEEGNSLVMRDDEDVIAVAEKLLEANDVPDAEVVLEMEVLEINDKDVKNLGLLLSNYSVSLGAFSPQSEMLSTSLFSDSSAPSPVDVSQLVRAFSIKGFGGYVTVPNATYNFGKNLSQGEVLSNPKLRVKNKEKAKFNVGQRVPIQTSTTVNTTTSFNVQYVDVGVKVSAEPTIQLNNEVSIKLGLEVSSVINKETARDGTTLVTIGTRNLETALSLKDGETSIIGGLIQHGTTDDKVKVFILGDLPLIGPLLSNNKTEKNKSELILAVTPRLVRGVTVPSRSYAYFASGKEDDPALTTSYASFEQQESSDKKSVRKERKRKPAHEPAEISPEKLQAAPLSGAGPQPPNPAATPPDNDGKPPQTPTSQQGSEMVSTPHQTRQILPAGTSL